MFIRKVVVPLLLIVILGAFLCYQYLTTKQFSIYDWLIIAGVSYLLFKLVTGSSRTRNG